MSSLRSPIVGTVVGVDAKTSGEKTSLEIEVKLQIAPSTIEIFWVFAGRPPSEVLSIMTTAFEAAWEEPATSARITWHQEGAHAILDKIEKIPPGSV